MTLKSLTLLFLVLWWDIDVVCRPSQENCPENIVLLIQPVSFLASPTVREINPNCSESCRYKPEGEKQYISTYIPQLSYNDTSLSSCFMESDYAHVLGWKISAKNTSYNFSSSMRTAVPTDCNDTSQHQWDLNKKGKCVYLCQSASLFCMLTPPSEEEDNDGWEKATFSVVIVASILAFIVVIVVNVRKRIQRARKRLDDSPANAKRTFKDYEDEDIPGTSGYSQTSDPEFGSGAYSLTSSENEGGRNYRPLRRPVRNTNPPPSARHFDLRPSVHRAFKDDDDDEMYTKINDDEIDCDAADRQKHDAAISCHDGAEMSYFEPECGGQDDNTTSYNRLGRHGDKDEATQSESVTERNYGRLRCHTGLAEISVCDEYELAKPITEADFSSGKDEEKSFHDDTASDGQYEKEAGPNTRHLPNQNCSTVAAADVDGLIRESEEHGVHSETNVSAGLPQRISGTDDTEDATTSSSYDYNKGDNCQPASDSEQHDLMTELGSKTNAEERETPRSQGDKVAPSPSPVGKPSHNLYD